jgi:glycosyltransferase involved in cell wall biosynthesis
LGKWKPDCLHCHGYYAALAALILRTTGLYVPIVYTIHANVDRGLQRSDFLIRRIAPACDWAVAVSQYTADAMERFTGGVVRPQVIRNGIDLERLELRGDFCPEAKRKALGVGEKALLLITVAALNRPKDYPTLFRAYSEFLRSSGDAQLLVVGDGGERAELQDLVRRLGIHNRVLFLGRRSDVHELLAAADIFVLSTHTEAFPISVIEACCIGIPVVATEAGGLTDLRRLGLQVVLSEPESASSLRDALLSLLDLQRRHLVGRQLREQARLFFDIRRAADCYRSVYDNLLAPNQACEQTG